MNPITIYIELSDGLYNAYLSNSDKYIVGLTRPVQLEPHVAQALCEITNEYNKSQELLYGLYNS